MAEYIDRGAAKKEFALNFGSVSHAVIANRLLDSIPAADVEEVKHGRWIKRGQDIFCSECGGESKYTWHGSSSFSNYCPSCGAKMDGGKENAAD